MDKKLLERYFTGGTCSQEELMEIHAYLDNPDDLLEQFLAAEWQQARGQVNEKRKEKTLHNILAATGEAIPPKAAAIPVRWLQTIRHYRVAAAIAALIITGSILLFTNKSRNTSIGPAQQAWQTVQNNSDTVKTFTLPDRTTVWLNSYSSISFAANFGKEQTRELKLSGEAYFDVARDVNRPFKIYTDSLQTTVLGTSFSLRAWPHTPNIQVALVKGSVRVSGFNNTISETLLPGDLLVFSVASRSIKRTRQGISADMYEWTDGKIVLSNTPVIEALQQLEQIYRVTIRYNASELKDKKLTGKFKRDDIATVLGNLSFAAGMSFSQKDGIYFITNQ